MQSYWLNSSGIMVDVKTQIEGKLRPTGTGHSAVNFACHVMFTANTQRSLINTPGALAERLQCDTTFLLRILTGNTQEMKNRMDQSRRLSTRQAQLTPLYSRLVFSRLTLKAHVPTPSPGLPAGAGNGNFPTLKVIACNSSTVFQTPHSSAPERPVFTGSQAKHKVAL